MAIIYVKQPAKAPAVVAKDANTASTQNANINIKPITNADHIYGNPNAEIKIIEYSDTSCPFCKAFNPVMENIISEYGPTGKVAWVYRYFPLDKPDANGNILHKNSGNEAEALECSASLGGNDKFWAFEKALYEMTPSVTATTPNGLDQAQLPVIAKNIGFNVSDFKDCLSSGQFADKIDAEYTDGINAGVNGTPYSFLITPSGSKIPFSGSLPYSSLKSAIDSILSSSNQ
jgi:protein-disulfide isomerase